MSLEDLAFIVPKMIICYSENYKSKYFATLPVYFLLWKKQMTHNYQGYQKKRCQESDAAVQKLAFPHFAVPQSERYVVCFPLFLLQLFVTLLYLDLQYFQLLLQCSLQHHLAETSFTKLLLIEQLLLPFNLVKKWQPLVACNTF